MYEAIFREDIQVYFEIAPDTVKIFSTVYIQNLFLFRSGGFILEHFVELPKLSLSFKLWYLSILHEFERQSRGQGRGERDHRRRLTRSNGSLLSQVFPPLHTSPFCQPAFYTLSFVLEVIGNLDYLRFHQSNVPILLELILSRVKKRNTVGSVNSCPT